MLKLPKQLSQPFANKGDRIDIPYTANVGNVNYDVGYDPTFGAPLDQGGSEIQRQGHNGVLYDVTDNIYSYQKGVYNFWREYVPGTEQSEVPVLESYAQGAMVWYNKIDFDPNSSKLIRSKKDNNQSKPIDADILAGTSDWEYVFQSFSPVIITEGTRIRKGINDPAMNGFIKLDGRAITDAQYALIPLSLQSQITVGSAGNWKLIDTRGFSKDVEIIQSTQQKVEKFPDGRMRITISNVYFDPLNPEFTIAFLVPFDFIVPMGTLCTGVIRVGGYYQQYFWTEDTGSLFFTTDYITGTLRSRGDNVYGWAYIVVEGWWKAPFTRDIFCDIPVTVDQKVQFNVPTKDIFLPILDAGETIIGYNRVILDIDQIDYSPIQVVIKKDINTGKYNWYIPPNSIFPNPNIEKLTGEYLPDENALLNNTGFNYFNGITYFQKPEKDILPYDVCDQILVLQDTTALRLQSNYNTNNYSYDNKTIKLNDDKEFYVNFDPVQAAWDSTTDLIEIVPTSFAGSGLEVLDKKLTIKTGDGVSLNAEGFLEVVEATESQAGIVVLGSEGTKVPTYAMVDAVFQKKGETPARNVSSAYQYIKYDSTGTYAGLDQSKIAVLDGRVVDNVASGIDSILRQNGFVFRDNDLKWRRVSITSNNTPNLYYGGEAYTKETPLRWRQHNISSIENGLANSYGDAEGILHHEDMTIKSSNEVSPGSIARFTVSFPDGLKMTGSTFYVSNIVIGTSYNSANGWIGGTQFHNCNAKIEIINGNGVSIAVTLPTDQDIKGYVYCRCNIFGSGTGISSPMLVASFDTSIDEKAIFDLIATGGYIAQLNVEK